VGVANERSASLVSSTCSIVSLVLGSCPQQDSISFAMGVGTSSVSVGIVGLRPSVPTRLYNYNTMSFQLRGTKRLLLDIE